MWLIAVIRLVSLASRLFPYKPRENSKCIPNTKYYFYNVPFSNIVQSFSNIVQSFWKITNPSVGDSITLKEIQQKYGGAFSSDSLYKWLKDQNKTEKKYVPNLIVIV